MKTKLFALGMVLAAAGIGNPIQKVSSLAEIDGLPGGELSYTVDVTGLGKANCRLTWLKGEWAQWEVFHPQLRFSYLRQKEIGRVIDHTYQSYAEWPLEGPILSLPEVDANLPPDAFFPQWIEPKSSFRAMLTQGATRSTGKELTTTYKVDGSRGGSAVYRFTFGQGQLLNVSESMNGQPTRNFVFKPLSPAGLRPALSIPVTYVPSEMPMEVLPFEMGAPAPAVNVVTPDGEMNLHEIAKSGAYLLLVTSGEKGLDAPAKAAIDKVRGDTRLFTVQVDSLGPLALSKLGAYGTPILYFVDEEALMQAAWVSFDRDMAHELKGILSRG